MRPCSRRRAIRATSRAASSCSRVGKSMRRFTRAQPRYCVFASSSRSASRDSASAITSATRSRFSRCSTTLSVSGNPSSFTQRATSSLRSNARVPAIRSDAVGVTSWIETCTLSRPSAFSPASRARVSGIPLVIRLVYRSSRRAPSTSGSRSSRSSGSPPVRLSCTTPSASASRNTRNQSSVVSASAWRAQSVGFEQYAQRRGQR